jgi:hypothetical protein
MIKNYSQAGQDIFVLSLFNNTDQRYFVDIGCWVPTTLNNTMLLEENGWLGISLDITDLSDDWKSRNTPFIVGDALKVDYKKLFDDCKLPNIIDYLNIDIEGKGDRFKTLNNVFLSDRDFKVITIEHDSYRGLEEFESKPQRDFLLKKGFVLLCSNVKLSNNPFEDWWINPNYFSIDDYKHLISNDLEYTDIIKKIKL